MARYRVFFEQINATSIVVVANNEEEAKQRALEVVGTIERGYEDIEDVEILTQK